MKIKISNPETNPNSVKVTAMSQSTILLPGTEGEFGLSQDHPFRIWEVPSLIYIEKELTGPTGRIIEVK